MVNPSVGVGICEGQQLLPFTVVRISVRLFLIVVVPHLRPTELGLIKNASDHLALGCVGLDEAARDVGNTADAELVEQGRA